MQIFTKTIFLSASILCFLVAFNITAADEWPDPPAVAAILADEGISQELNSEWDNSRASDRNDRHEEGGWIIECRAWNPSTEEYEFTLVVRSVPAGRADGLTPGTPPNEGENCRAVGFKHTHPNPPTDENGNRWDQGPSEADKSWHERHKIPGIIVNAAGTATTGPDSGTYE